MTVCVYVQISVVDMADQIFRDSKWSEDIGQRGFSFSSVSYVPQALFVCLHPNFECKCSPFPACPYM